jgi:RHS repeat-associated protein
MTSITINPNNVSTFTPSTATTYNPTYDDNGNLVQKQNTADPSDSTLYAWDARNRLSGMTSPTGQTSTFKYDALNRRVEKTVDGQTLRYAYDGPQAILEIASSAQTTAILAGLTIDEVIARYSQSGNSYYLQDALLSVIAQTDDAQAVTNFYSYSPYGETQTLGPDGGNAIQFTGRENDQTGLYYYRARYYDPLIKRFVNEDPIGVAGGLNVYGYVGGDPINLIDPTGNASTCYSAGPGCSGAGPGNFPGNGIVKTPPGGGCLVAVWRGGYIVGWKPCQDPTPVPPTPTDPDPDPICPPPPPPPPPPTTNGPGSSGSGGTPGGGRPPGPRCNEDALRQCLMQARRNLVHEAGNAVAVGAVFMAAEFGLTVAAGAGLVGAAAAPIVAVGGVLTLTVEATFGLLNFGLDVKTCGIIHCW